MKSLSTPQARSARTGRIALYAYSAVLFLMHFIRIFDNSFWGDEGFTISLVKMSFADMVRATAQDVHPPLYYFFTQILCRIFGYHGFVYHLSAVIPYGLLLVLCCTLVCRWFGVIPAAVCVTLSSLGGSAIVYNVEARMYALAALFVFAAYLALYQIYQKNRVIDWLIFTAASLGAAYTHYYALIAVAVFYLMLLPMIARSKKNLRRILITYASTVVLYLFWLVVLLRSLRRTAGGWWLENIPTISDCLTFLFDHAWVTFFFFAVFALLLLRCVGIVRTSCTHRPDDSVLCRMELLAHPDMPSLLSTETLWLAAGFLSAVGVVLAGLELSYAFRPFFIPRYLFPVAPVIYLVFGYGIAKLSKRQFWASVLICGVLVCNFPTYFKTFRHERHVEYGTKVCTEFFTSSADPIIYTNDHAWNFTYTAENLFPLIPYVNSQNALQSIDGSHSDQWVFWKTALTAEEKALLKEKGYSAQEVYTGCAFHDIFTGKFRTDPTEVIFHLYRLEKLTDAQ